MKNLMRLIVRALLITCVCLGAPALAHVGSPDVFYEGDAGPYHLLITVRPPGMIPGVAQVEIRSTTAPMSVVQVVPVYLTARDAGLPPTPDPMQPVPGDPQSFSGKVWLMASGSWEVRVQADGPQGKGELALPVPAGRANEALRQSNASSPTIACSTGWTSARAMLANFG